MHLNATANSTSTPTPSLAETMTNDTNTLNTIQVTVSNWNGNRVDTIIDSLSVIKTWTIIISISVLSVIVIKLIKMCTKMYKKHNEIVIKKHSRISPEM